MSGDGTIKVKFESVQQVEDRIHVAIKKLTDRLDRLESELNPIQASWTGDARTAYAVDKAKWDQAAADMNVVLTQIKQAVRAAHEQYVMVNKKTTALF